MNVSPMRLMINSDATPVAHHTSLPVPLHWQEEVKAGLDQDVRLGIIESVLVGIPVTWYHRMVICPRKSGEPRRTMDFQSLRPFYARDTSHHVAISPGPADPLKYEVDCSGCLEWLSQHPIAP